MQLAGFLQAEAPDWSSRSPADPAAELGTGPWRPMAWERVVPALERQAAAMPSRIAVRCGDRALTYAELDAGANRLARLLMELGVGRGDRIALVLPRDVDAVVAILAVLKSGAAYVPIDIAYPEARIRFIVEDCAARAVVTTSAHLSKLPAGVTAVALDREAEAVAAKPADAIPALAGPDDAIYVIYTSGSTGQPKGAAVTHRSFANLLQWYIATLALDARDSTLLVSALGFDLTQKNLYAPLLVGGTLNLPDFDTFDPEAMVSTIEARSITFVNCTPSTFLPLAEGPGAGRPERLASLRWVVLGGEPIPIKRLLPWLQHPSCRGRILNSYGPTECTDICAAWAVDGRSWQDPVPLGRPIDNVFLAVLDDCRRPVGIGVEGELWIGGAGVGLGYLARPAMNAERFMTLEVPGHTGRMYRTGDRVSWRADGTLDFFGRLDHQIKIRGHRVELGEIETALSNHPAIREACAIVRKDEGAEPCLVAYLVARQGAAVPADVDLRRHLAGSVPEHMVPSVFVRLAAMPLSPNGKIDRHALPDPAVFVAAAPPRGDEAGIAAPAGPEEMENMVLEIWQTALRRRPDSHDQNFFDVGGTSLTLAEVQALIKRRLGRDLSIVTLFAHPTVASLARHLNQEHKPRPAVPTSGLKQAEALRRMAAARGARR